MQFSTLTLLASSLAFSNLAAAAYQQPRFYGQLASARPLARSVKTVYHGVSANPLDILKRQVSCGSGATCTEACESCGSGYVWCGTEINDSCDCANTAAGETCAGSGGSVPTPTISSGPAETTPVVGPGSTTVCGSGSTCQEACSGCGVGSGWCGTYIDANTCGCYRAGETCCSNGGTCDTGTFCALSGDYCCANGETVDQCAAVQGFSVPPGQGSLTAAATTIQTPVGGGGGGAATTSDDNNNFSTINSDAFSSSSSSSSSRSSSSTTSKESFTFVTPTAVSGGSATSAGSGTTQTHAAAAGATAGVGGSLVAGVVAMGVLLGL